MGYMGIKKITTREARPRNILDITDQEKGVIPSPGLQKEKGT